MQYTTIVDRNRDYQIAKENYSKIMEVTDDASTVRHSHYADIAVP
jgi:hypothetical protein